MFKGRQFDHEIIVLCVRWYLRYKLSFCVLVEILSERGITLTHTISLRSVQRYVSEFQKSWDRYARPVGGSRRCDETYLKVQGRWTPFSFSWCPPCSMSRSTSKMGSDGFNLRPNLHGPTHSPRRVLRAGRSRARYRDLQALELVSDLRATSSEFVVQADR